MNNPPVVAMTASARAYTGGQGALVFDAGITVSDTDSPALTGATMTISGNLQASEDTLAFTTQNGITGSFNATTGVLSLTGSATVAHYQAALRSVTYANTASSPATITRTVTVVVTDGTATSNAATRALIVSAAPNQPPVVTTTAGALAYTAGSAAAIADVGLLVADADSPTLVRAVITISAAYVVGDDVLAFANQGGITGSFNAATGVLTLTGSATVAQYQAALRGVTFATPANASTLTRTITVVGSDAQADSLPATRQITVASASQPTLDQPASVTVDEDSGPATVALSGISAGPSGGTLSVVAQAVNAGLFAGFSVSYQDPNGTASLAFTPAPDVFGTTDVAVTVTAGGATSGRTTTRTFRITVTSVNDRPTLDALQDRTGLTGAAQSVALTGIGMGALNEAQTLSVTVSSSNPGVVASGTITYLSPASTGALSVMPLSAGVTTMTVTVNDGDTTNATVARTFVVTVAAAQNTPPTITAMPDITSIEGNPLPGTSFTIGDAETAASALTVTVRSLNGSLIPAAGLAIAGTGATRGLTLVNAPNRIGRGPIVVTVSDGEFSASSTFTAVVSPLWNYYLPDGWATSDSATDIRATNPHGVAAPIRVTFVTPAGAPQHQLFEIAAGSRWTARLSAMPLAGGGEVSTFIRSVARLPLLVERTMTWDADAHAGSAETALESTNLQWYFAEGAQTALRTNLILANPNATDATVSVTFLLDSGVPVVRGYTVNALSRRTLSFGGIPELAGRSFGMVVDASLPIAAERTMYLDAPRARQGGHSSVGVPFPSSQWYFAEGSAWKIFQTYMLLANPGTTAAKVRIAYHTMVGAHFTTDHVVAPRSRLTVDTLKEEPRLDGAHFWMSVTSDQPIVAERSMYWDRGMPGLTEGHNSHGVIEPSRHWSTGDARVGGPQQYSTYVLIGNPTQSTATLTVTIKRDNGADIVSTRHLAPLGRDTINVNTAVPSLSNESFWLLIDSDVPILAERSQYWGPDPSRGSWSAGTNAFALPVVGPDYNGCAYSVGPQAVTAPAQGARFQLNVGTTSRCTFTAEPSAAWLRVTEGGSGNGVATVTVRVDPNPSSGARTGTIVVAGQSVTVDQSAAPPAGVGDPQMTLDAPLNGARVGSVFRVTGWAVDLAATDNTPGVSTVHVWAYPSAGSNAVPVFLGVAAYGAERPAIEARFGERTRRSGFSLDVRGLPRGAYSIAVFAYSTVTQSFSQARAAAVIVQPDPRVVIDIPGAGPLTQPARIAGWAVDFAADGATGIDAVDVWAYPADGAAPRFVGSASYGHARPDVATAYGKPDFINSGYSLSLSGLAAGRYQLVVFARRTGSAVFDGVQLVNVEIAQPEHLMMALDTPSENQVVGRAFSLSGWALDLAAARGPGVDVVHVWAYPASGASPVFLGAADYGAASVGVPAYVAEGAKSCGFTLRVADLAPGTYRVVAFAHSTVSGLFDQSRVRTVTVSAIDPR